MRSHLVVGIQYVCLLSYGARPTHKPFNRTCGSPQEPQNIFIILCLVFSYTHHNLKTS